MWGHLLTDRLDLKTLKSMNNWEIFRSYLESIKIPIENIFKIFKLIHVDSSDAGPSSQPTTAHRNGEGKRVKVNLKNSQSDIVNEDLSKEHFNIGNYTSI